MKVKRKPEDNQRIEEAVKFLVSCLEKSNQSTKPVITHCLRVAFSLDAAGYPSNVVIAALLHDILEDSNASLKEVERKFGPKIAELIRLLTFDSSIKDKTARYKRNFLSAKESGKEALVIRAVDLLDNSGYYHLVKDRRLYQWLLDKLDYFLEISREIIGQEEVFKRLIISRKKLVNF